VAKQSNYYVIGGQYESCCYGGTPTLLGAKRLANAHQEYWDNWQGWHTPNIYASEDTERIICNGWITKPEGSTTRIAKENAYPVEW
jgi:hypothetical protein